MLLCYFVWFHLILGEPPILVCSRFGHHGGCCSLQVRQLFFFSCHPWFSGVFFSFTEDFFFLHNSLFFFFQEMEKGGGGQGYCGVQVLVHFILDFQIFWTSWLTGRMFWNWLTVINHYIIFFKNRMRLLEVPDCAQCVICQVNPKHVNSYARYKHVTNT